MFQHGYKPTETEPTSLSMPTLERFTLHGQEYRHT